MHLQLCLESLTDVHMNRQPCTIMNVGGNAGGIWTSDQYSSFGGITNSAGDYFDGYEMFNGQGIPIASADTLTVEYGSGLICPAPVSVQYNTRTNLCYKTMGVGGTCTSWCQPGTMDCIDPTDREQVVITQVCKCSLGFCLKGPA